MLNFPATRLLTRPPRLQIFVSDLSATGVVRNAVSIANAAAVHGYEVRLLTCKPDGVLKEVVDPAVTIMGLLPRSVRVSSRKVQLFRAYRTYRRHTFQWAPDVLLSAGNHGHMLSTFAWAGSSGTKILRISNEIDRSGRSVLKSLVRRAKYRLVTGLADRLVLVSRSHHRNPMLARLIASGKASVIGNGADIEQVRIASQEPCSHPWLEAIGVPVVLAVGRHAREKNFEGLMKGFALARKSREIRLIIVGDGHPDLKDRLHKLAVELGIADDVSLVPATPNPFPYFSRATMLALPSLWEGSSNVLLEALACELPIVASRTAGDAGALLENGRFGILVDPTDHAAIGNAILHQTGTGAILPGDRALNFSKAVTLQAYLSLFRQCTEAGKCPALQTAFLSEAVG